LVVADPAPNTDATAITRLLESAGKGDPRAADELLPLVYQQLRAVAQQRIAQERPDHTLQATALVHEAYMRLVGNNELSWDGRGHFYVAAAEAMRRILIEHARSRGRLKRGGDRRREPINVLDLAAAEDSEQIVALDEAVRRLESQDPRAAQIVHLRFYGGLGVEQTAETLGISPRTVKREWAVARAWLYNCMQQADGDGENGDNVTEHGVDER
jgi:RNA polymerase sigma factor (TIGR02999 family)